jgi:hypothetical protein
VGFHVAQTAPLPLKGMFPTVTLKKVSFLELWDKPTYDIKKVKISYM